MFFIMLLRPDYMIVFRQEWSARIFDSHRACFFRVVIKEHFLHHFLDVVNVPAHRVSLIRLICSSHRLGIETGRWTRPVTPQENRKCTVCNRLDDEYHLLLECTLFNDLRKKLIKRIYWEKPSMAKCISLLNDKDTKVLRNVAKFVYKAFLSKEFSDT